MDQAASSSTVSRDIIPRQIKISWSVGALGVAFMMNTVAGSALFYLISVLEVQPALAGLVVFVPKLFDAITDPIVGAWSDRLSAGKSRRRPFLLVGAVISALSFLMLFTTPRFDHEYITAAYAFVALIIFAIGYTVFNIPYLSMPAEMTDDYHERSSIHSYRVMAISIAGFVAGAALPLFLEHMGRTDWMTYAIVGVAGGILIFVTMMVSWIGTANARFTEAQTVRPNPFSELRHVLSNGHFVRLLLVKFMQLFGVAATIASFKYFILYVMNRDFADLALYGLVVGIVALFAAPVFVAVSKRIGKSQTYMLSATFYVIAVASWSLAEANEPIPLILARGVLLGLAGTGNVIMAMSMLTDIINYDGNRSGVRREGVFVSFYSFIEKFTFSLGPLVAGLALQFAGYQEDLTQAAKQSPEIRQAILLGVSYIPAVMGVLSIALLAGYKLRQEDVQAPVASPAE